MAVMVGWRRGPGASRVLSLLPPLRTRPVIRALLVFALGLPLLLCQPAAHAQDATGSERTNPSRRDPRADALVEQAAQARTAGRRRAALQRYRQALRRDPGHGAALLGFAELALAPILAGPARPGPNRLYRELRAAVQTYRAHSDTEAWAARYAEALVLAAEGHHRAAAARTAGPGVGHDPRAAAWLDRIALVAARRGDLRAADECTERARQLAPSISRDVALADLRMARGRAAEAVAVLRHAAQMSRDNPTVLRRLGEALMAAGRPAEAVPVLRDIVPLCGPTCHAVLVRAMLQAGDHEGAGEEARALTASSPGDDPRGPLLEGLAAAASGETELARARLREASRRAPRDPSVRQALRALSVDSDGD